MAVDPFPFQEEVEDPCRVDPYPSFRAVAYLEGHSLGVVVQLVGDPYYLVPYYQGPYYLDP